MLVKKLIVVFSIILSGCNNDNNERRSSDIELINQAKQLPLQARYDLYEKVFNSDRPPDTLLADEVASLGKPALQYALNEARRGETSDILAAIEIVRRLARGASKRCDVNDVSLVEKNIEQRFDNQSAVSIVKQRFRFACAM